MEKVFISGNEDETAAIAEKLSAITRQGDVWALNGTLGAGKSVFARAFIKKMTKAAEVPSPTFTLVQTYDAGGVDIYHYDLYRVERPEEIFELGVEEAFYSGISLVEWPERMGGFAPRNMWLVNIDITPQGRKIVVTSNDESKLKRLQYV